MHEAENEVAERSEKQASSISKWRFFLGYWEDAASRGLIVVVAILLAWYTWARWGDIQVDCGRELYVPVEILRGKLIYRDFFYSYGPLAPYSGALLIAVFGQHLAVFYLFGLAVAIGCAMLLFELGVMLESRSAGLSAALALLFVGFAPNASNYVFPYSYAATLGLLLSLLCALFTVRHLLDRQGYNLMLAGFAASFTLLSKQEFGIACYLMLAFVLVMEAVLQRSIRPLLRGIAACAPGVVLWVAILGWFFWALTPAFMVDANWIGMPGTYSTRTYGRQLYSLIGYRFVPLEMVALAIRAALSLMLWFLLARASWRLRNGALAIIVAIAVANRFGILGWVTWVIIISILVFPRGMFFIGCGFVAYAIYELFKGTDRRRLAEAAVGIFALIPAVRVFAKVVPFGYGVFYAMPLFLVFVLAISRCIKAATPALSIDQQRRVVNYLLAAEVVLIALTCIPGPAQRTATLETSWGVVYLEPQEAAVAQQVLDFMTEEKRQGRRVAVVPEAPMFYAFAGTEAPSRWYMLLPGLLSPAQEDIYIADLNASGPDYILVTGRRTHEYGADYFGIDYNKKVYRWIESNYRVVGKFGRFSRDENSSPMAALLYEKIGTVHADRSADK